MTKILIAYGTTEGQTARIAKYLADDIRGRGHVAEVVDLKRAHDGVPDDYDAVILEARSIWASMRTPFGTSP
jgi:menaquinone-dependent protoporphyrinogen oxidase